MFHVWRRIAGQCNVLPFVRNCRRYWVHPYGDFQWFVAGDTTKRETTCIERQPICARRRAA